MTPNCCGCEDLDLCSLTSTLIRVCKLKYHLNMLFWVLVRRGPSISFFLEYIWANLSAYIVLNSHGNSGSMLVMTAAFIFMLLLILGNTWDVTEVNSPSLLSLFSDSPGRLNYLLSVAFPRTYPWTWSYSEAVQFYSLVWLDCSLHWDAFRLIRAFLSKEWFLFMILSPKPNIAPGTCLPLK